jgi:hypothetical protein
VQDAQSHKKEDRKRDVYKPTEVVLTLSHAESPRKAYTRFSEDDVKGVVYCSELKNIMKDVSFLTDKSMPGDTVIYIGNTMGRWVETVSRMFPMLQFIVYDGNPTKVQTCMAEGTLKEDPVHTMKHPGNVHLRNTWFNVQEAENLTTGRNAPLSPTRTLMMVETRNMSHAPEDTPPSDPVQDCTDVEESMKHGTASQAPFVERDIMKDMADQDAWLHVLKPRSALLKFNLPYQGAKSYSYMSGTMLLQPFAQKMCTEVQLVVDRPKPSMSSLLSTYPRELYSSQAHDECMLFHNVVTRTEHMRSDARIKVC